MVSGSTATLFETSRHIPKSDERFVVAVIVIAILLSSVDVLSVGVLLGIVLDYRLLLVLVEHSHERRQYRLVADVHQVREGFPERGRGLFQVVMRYPAEHVVHLVRADRMDDVVYDAVMAVDGRQLAAHEVPSVVGIPQDADLRVVKERDNDDVGPENEDRHQIVDCQRGEPVHIVEVIQTRAHDSHGHQREQASDHVTNEHFVEQVKVFDASRAVAVIAQTQVVQTS